MSGSGLQTTLFCVYVPPFFPPPPPRRPHPTTEQLAEAQYVRRCHACYYTHRFCDLRSRCTMLDCSRYSMPLTTSSSIRSLQ